MHDIPTIAPDRMEFERTGRLFPHAIESDPWILYHGTSDQFAPSIEKAGLQYPPNLVSREELEALIDIAASMWWTGESRGGMPVLLPFSRNFDFRRGTKPIYLAEASLKAVTFTRSEFAGGETARASRLFLHDLEEYLTSPRLRQKHRSERRMCWAALKACSLEPPENPRLDDLDWLRDRMADLQPLKQRLLSYGMAHRHGVVYAIRIPERETAGLRDGGPMGIEALDPIPPDQIVARADLPPPDWAPPMFIDIDPASERGILKAIRADPS